MKNILDKYGIKEVADVVFYALNDAGQVSHPVLFLDSLKVTTLEQTAEETQAQGGKGNVPMIIWDYGKEIILTLQDALFSPKSLGLMFGGQFQTIGGKRLIMRSEFVTVQETIPKNQQIDLIDLKQKTNYQTYYAGPQGNKYYKTNPKFFTADGVRVDGSNIKEDLTRGTTLLCSYDLSLEGIALDVNANSFPGTYCIMGTSHTRNQESGKDESFDFIIPKAKIQTEMNLTLEADGDPTVFDMNVKVLRQKDGKMLQLIKHSLKDAQTDSNGKSDLITAEELASISKDAVPLKDMIFAYKSEEGTRSLKAGYYLVGFTKQPTQKILEIPNQVKIGWSSETILGVSCYDYQGNTPTKVYIYQNALTGFKESSWQYNYVEVKKSHNIEKIVFSQDSYILARDALMNMSNLKSLDGTKMRYPLRGYFQCAKNCAKLSEFNFPQGVSLIENNAFEGAAFTHLFLLMKKNTQLSELTQQPSLYGNAFAKCNNLNEVYITVASGESYYWPRSGSKTPFYNCKEIDILCVPWSLWLQEGVLASDPTPIIHYNCNFDHFGDMTP